MKLLPNLHYRKLKQLPEVIKQPSQLKEIITTTIPDYPRYTYYISIIGVRYC